MTSSTPGTILTDDTRMLDCGHNPSEHSPYTTGTARTADGREICCDCADKEQVQDLLTETSYVAYLSVEKEGNTLTTWTGGKLATITTLCKNRHNMGGYLYHFQAIDVHSQRWYGTSPGPGMYARMRKNKGQ